MFVKYTSFHDAAGTYHTPGHGHWKQSAIASYCENHKLIQPVTITHQVLDGSGHGRGGHDGRYIYNKNEITRVATFKEFGREHQRSK